VCDFDFVNIINLLIFSITSFFYVNVSNWYIYIYIILEFKLNLCTSFNLFIFAIVLYIFKSHASANSIYPMSVI